MSKHAFSAAIFAVAVLAGTPCVGVATAQSVEPSQAEEAIEKLVAALKPEADAFAEANDDRGPAPNERVKRLQYTNESIKPLTKAMGGRYGKPAAEMYVCYQLLQPLRMANDETLRPLKPTLLHLLQRRCRYEPMPRWPKNSLAALNPAANLSHEELAKEMRLIQQRRDEKKKAEMPVVKLNRTVREVEKTTKHLLALMADNSADEALLKRLEAEERAGLITYHDTLEAIRDRTRKMEQSRAKKLYEKLKALAFSVGKKKRYVDPTRPSYGVTGNSSFQTHEDYFGVSAAKVVNLLATAAKEPAVPIPDVKKFEARQKQKGAGG